MVIRLMLAAVMAVTALGECAVALRCLHRGRRLRVIAVTLLILAPLQVVSLFFARDLVMAMHTQSSFDAPTDGFDILVKEAAVTGGLMLLSVGLALALAAMSLTAEAGRCSASGGPNGVTEK